MSFCRARRLENVESEIQYLRRQLDDMRHFLQQESSSGLNNSATDLSPKQTQPNALGRDHASGCSPYIPRPETIEAATVQATPGNVDCSLCQRHSQTEISSQSLYLPQASCDGQFRRPAKRKRSAFEIREQAVEDFIDKGLITLEFAMSCFETSVTAS